MLLRFAPPHIIPRSVILYIMQVVKRQLNRARPIGGRGTCACKHSYRESELDTTQDLEREGSYF